MNRLLATISMLLFSTNIYAASGTLKAQVVTRNAQLVFDINGASYNLTSMAGKAITTFTGSGLLAGYNQTDEMDLSQAMPNTAKGEWTTVSLERTGARTGNLHSEIYQKSATGDIQFADTIEFEFVTGSWAEYDAGNEVKIQLTKKGIEQDRASQKRLGIQLAENLKVALQGQGVRVNSASIDIQTSENDIYTLSKTQLTQTQAFMKIDLTMIISK